LALPQSLMVRQKLMDRAWALSPRLLCSHYEQMMDEE